VLSDQVDLQLTIDPTNVADQTQRIAMSALTPEADIPACVFDVRFVPIADKVLGSVSS
jgi:hypothetical protein